MLLNFQMVTFGVVNENGNLNVKLAKNLKGLDSVTVGSDPNKQVVLDDKGVSVGR